MEPGLHSLCSAFTLACFSISVPLIVPFVARSINPLLNFSLYINYSIPGDWIYCNLKTHYKLFSQGLCKDGLLSKSGIKKTIKYNVRNNSVLITWQLILNLLVGLRGVQIVYHGYVFVAVTEPVNKYGLLYAGKLQSFFTSMYCFNSQNILVLVF
jgi:hypothetical protein